MIKTVFFGEIRIRRLGDSQEFKLLTVLEEITAIIIIRKAKNSFDRFIWEKFVKRNQLFAVNDNFKHNASFFWCNKYTSLREMKFLSCSRKSCLLAKKSYKQKFTFYLTVEILEGNLFLLNPDQEQFYAIEVVFI